MHTEGKPREDTARLRLSTRPGEGPPETPACPHIHLGLPASRTETVSPRCGLCYGSAADWGIAGQSQAHGGSRRGQASRGVGGAVLFFKGG